MSKQQRLVILPPSRLSATHLPPGGRRTGLSLRHRSNPIESVGTTIGRPIADGPCLSLRPVYTWVQAPLCLPREGKVGFCEAKRRMRCCRQRKHARRPRRRASPSDCNPCIPATATPRTRQHPSSPPKPPPIPAKNTRFPQIPPKSCYFVKKISNFSKKSQKVLEIYLYIWYSILSAFCTGLFGAPKSGKTRFCGAQTITRRKSHYAKENQFSPL